MPLPKLELKPGVTESIIRAKDHDDIRVLLRDLHEGVEELGIGGCEVLAHDLYMEKKFGFDLCHVADTNVHRVWTFVIHVTDFKRTSEMLPPRVREELGTTHGRAKLARMFQAGMDYRRIEDRLSDPAVLYIRQQMKELQAKADQAQAEAQAEMHGGNPAPRRGLFGLGAQPATTHFLLQQRLAALSDIVQDLELGKHLP